jgi:predicted glycosyltransferase
MEFKDLYKLRKPLKKYLNYEGHNLWELSEVPVYENFIKFPKKRKKFDKTKEKFLRFFIKIKNRLRENKNSLNAKENKKIMMVVYGSSPINTFTPIIRVLKDEIRLIRYDPPSERITKDLLKRKNIESISIDSYSNMEIRKNIKKFSKFLERQWKKIKKDFKIKKISGEDYSKIMRALEYFCHTRKSYLEIIRLIELYKKAFHIEKPKVLIVSDDANVYGRVAVEVAKEMGIKTICIQHGQLEGNTINKNGTEKIIVNGNNDKKYLISKGIKKDKIEVTGQIRFDDLPKKMKFDKGKLCKKFGIISHKKVIVYSYQTPLPGENVIENAKNLFIKEIQKLPFKNEEVIITMRSDTKIPKEFRKKNIKLLPGADIQELAVCGDLLITAFSTAAIEFVLMGKPVISINIGSKPGGYIDYTKLGVGFTVYKEKDFEPSLKRCLEDKTFKKNFKKSRKKFIKDYNYKMDGKALERVLNIIKKDGKDY